MNSPLDNQDYRKYLADIDAGATHNGYFAIDKKTKHLKDPNVSKRTGYSDDVDAYDLILKDKERLLSFGEPTRFIFSHSALREGWDNLTQMKSAVFAQFQQNPEHFIAEASRLIKEQKASAIIEKLNYDKVEDRYETDIFTAAQSGQDLSHATGKLKKHVYDYCVPDSTVERRFVGELDVSDKVVVYAKLPRGFLIPTPVGDYNPDWGISFERGSVKHIYFVAETKGTMSSMQLRKIEEIKIACARKFFAEITEIDAEKVKYDVVTDYGKLMDIVGLERISQ